MPTSHDQTEAQTFYVKFEMFRYCSGRGLAGFSVRVWRSSP